MPIEQSFLGDFSGGEITAISATEPQQGQWGLLEGFVLDNNRRLQAQWAGVNWKIPVAEEAALLGALGVKDFGIVTDHILAVSSDTASEGWYIAKIKPGLEVPEWELLETPDPEGKLHVAGKMAYKVVSQNDVFWVDGLLCNSATELDVTPFMVYIDPRTDTPVVKSWTKNRPDTADTGEPDSMPHAGVCAMWGDFLILGDINYKSDDTSAFNTSNQARYRHGLWFSKPGETDRWDPGDVFFTGQKAGRNVVQAIYPLEQGLFVITCTLVSLLQGSPDDFIYRELREGISNCGRSGSAAWPAKGGVVWGDRQGYVWFSNGEIFQRIDEAIEIKDTRSVAAVGEYVFVSTETVTHVFRLFDENGGWTRLATPSGFKKMVATPRIMIGIEARDGVGSFFLDDEEFGLLDNENCVLWGPPLFITAYEFNNAQRGTFDGAPLRSKIRTRPLPGFGHEKRFWHRFGVRAKGDGRILSATSRPSANPEDRGYQTRVNGRLSRRFDYVFDAHGPSIEATFDVEFDGNVSVEHMTVWEHGGRLEK